MEKIKRIEIPGSEIKAGHLVIVCDADRPCPLLIAIITYVNRESKTVNLMYINDDTHIVMVHGRNMDEPTPLNHFGAKAYLVKGGFMVELDDNLPVTATYQDEKETRARYWQGYMEDMNTTLPLRPEAYPHILNPIFTDE